MIVRTEVKGGSKYLPLVFTSPAGGETLFIEMGMRQKEVKKKKGSLDSVCQV